MGAALEEVGAALEEVGAALEEVGAALEEVEGMAGRAAEEATLPSLEGAKAAENSVVEGLGELGKETCGSLTVTADGASTELPAMKRGDIYTRMFFCTIPISCALNHL